jgi:hypothetical protein
VKNRRNYYRILQVQPDAPIEIIRASYRTLMRELKQHPDLGGNAYAATLLNEAYEILSDPMRRSEYDRKLAARYTKNAVPPDRKSKRPLMTFFCPSCGRPLARKPTPGSGCPVCNDLLKEQGKDPPAAYRRRCVARIKRCGRVLFQASDPQKAGEAEIVDISLKGMRFRCEEKLDAGTVLKISAPLFKASAAVRNIRSERRAGRRIYSVGVAFLAVDFEDSRGTFLSTEA